MIEFRTGDLFESGCEALVNAVNCEGVMGGGIAAEFKRRYPDMFKDYQAACNVRKVLPGILHTYHVPNGVWVLNFPTKLSWRRPSEYRYIEDGLDALDEFVEALGMKSVAVPALGCGLGGLLFERVRDMIQKKHDEKWQDRLIAVYEPK